MRVGSMRGAVAAAALWLGTAALAGPTTTGRPAPAPSGGAAEPAESPAPTSPKPSEGPVTDADDGGSETRMTGKAPPPLAREPRPAELTFELPDPKNYDEYAELPYPHEVYLGAKALHLDPMFVHAVREGLELLYLRRYNEARDHFARVEETFPGTGVRAVADTLVWQALMLENFDYRYDKQYWVSSKQARAELEAALAKPGNEGWERLASAAIVGIESIHTMRQGSYLSALQLAFQAMEHIEKCREAAPEFVDLKLADGLYNYWRSVVTMNSKVLPDFGDHRVEGIEQMTVVEQTGLFMKPMASFALVFSWLEENDMKRASASCTQNRVKYPDNIVNNLTCGMVYTESRRYDDALAVYDRVLQVDPKNDRVHYLKGYTLLRKGDAAGAKTELERYLASTHLEDYQKSYAQMRMGQALARLEQYAAAVDAYKAAIKIDGNKQAKKMLDKLEERKKQKKIDW
ncbi:MAG: tetratricopeptide repeat protein [Myxococcota bacterium]